MGIIEGMLSGLLQAISLDVFPYLFVGAVFGLLIGVIPGLSGHFAMAMVIPFLYSMDPAPGIAFWRTRVGIAWWRLPWRQAEPIRSGSTWPIWATRS